MRLAAVLPYLAVVAPVFAVPHRARSCANKNKGQGANSTLTADPASGYAADNSTVLSSSFDSGTTSDSSANSTDPSGSQLLVSADESTPLSLNSTAPQAGQAGNMTDAHGHGHGHHRHHGAWNHILLGASATGPMLPGASATGSITPLNVPVGQKGVNVSAIADTNTDASATAVASPSVATGANLAATADTASPDPSSAAAADSNGVVWVTESVYQTTTVWVGGDSGSSAAFSAAPTEAPAPVTDAPAPSSPPASSTASATDTPTPASALNLSANPCQTDGCPSLSTATMATAAAAGTPTATAASDAQTWVDLHNDFRAQYGAGKVVWNPTLAAYAQNWASQCKFQHTGGPYGENLAAGSGSLSIQDGFKMWSDEASGYDWANPGFSEGTGHFTQVVWKDTTEIGCSMVTCPDNTIFSGYGSSTYHVCEYYTAGNVVGDSGNYFKQNVGAKV